MIADRRTWRFRVNPAYPDGIEKRIFDGPEDAPPSDGWAENRDAARALADGVAPLAAAAVPQEKPFEELSVAEQVAALERQAAGTADEQDPEDANTVDYGEHSGRVILRDSAQPPRGRPGRKPRAFAGSDKSPEAA